MDWTTTLRRLRFPLLAVTVALGFGALVLVPRLQTSTDVRPMLPDVAPEVDHYASFVETFGSDRVLALVLVRPAGFFEPAILEQLSGLSDALIAIPWVARVESITHTTSVASQGGMMEARALFVDPPFDEEQAAAGGAELMRNEVFVDNLISANGGAVALMVFLEERRVATEVVRRLPEAVRLDPVAYGEAGRALEATFNDVGLAFARGEVEGDLAEAKLAAARALAGSGVEGGGPLAARIERLEAEAAEEIARYDEVAVEQVGDLLEQYGARVTADRAMVGPPVLRLALLGRMAADVQQGIMGAMVLVLLLTWLGLRDPRRLLLPLGSAVMGLVWAAAALALLRVPIDQVTVAALFPAVALALSSAMVLGLEDEPRRGPLLGVLAGGAVLAALGLVQWSSDVEAVRRFGTTLAVGAGAGTLAPLLLVPVTVAMLDRPLPIPDPRPRRRWLLLVVLVFGMSAVGGLARLVIGIDYVEAFTPRDPIAEAWRTTEDHLAGMDAFRLHLVAEEIDRLKEPEVLAAVRTLQDRLEERPDVDATTSYVDLIEMIYQALDPQRADRLPQRRELVGQLLLLFGSPEAMRPFVTPDYDQAAITVRTRSGGGQDLRALLRDIEELAAEVLPADVRCTPRGELLLTSRAADETTRRLLTGSARSLILCIALMMIATRRVWPFIRLVLPLCLATSVSFGATALGSLSLGPVTVVAPWIGLAACLPLVLARAGEGRPGPRDWLPLAVAGAAFLPLLASSLRFDAALGVGVAVGCTVAAAFLWADGGVEAGE